MRRIFDTRKVDKAYIQYLIQEYSYNAPEPRIDSSKGFLTKEDFLAIAIWKTKRQTSNYKENDAAFVESVTKTAFSTNNERLRIEVLTLLSGVQYPVASTILHFGYDGSKYPIIDFRALWTLYDLNQSEIKYSFELWTQYVEDCKELAAKYCISIRDLDKALWQYSRLHQK